MKSATENVGHNVYMDNFFSSPNFDDSLHMNKTNCLGTLKPNTKGMPIDFGETMTLNGVK
jgi:hypothetical protein